MPRKPKYPVMTPEISRSIHLPLYFQQFLKSFEGQDEVLMTDEVRSYFWQTPQEQEEYLKEHGLTVHQGEVNEKNKLIWVFIKRKEELE